MGVHMLPPLVTGLIGGVLCCSRLLAARRPPKRQALTRIAPEVLQSGGSSLSTASATADTVSLVSFNTLADCNAWGLDHSAPELLAWHYRWPRIAAALKAADADVVCLQDVDTARLGDLESWATGHGYEVASQEAALGRNVLIVTLFKARRFSLWWADRRRARAVCCALLYQDSAGHTQALYVANCQLDSRPDRSTERLAQARGILGSLASHQASQRLPPEACSVAVAGCFSEGPDGAVAHLLRYGWAPAGGAVDDALAAGRGEEEATQPYLLQDACESKPLPYTHMAPGLASTVDFVWVSSHAAVAQLLHAQHPRDARGMPHAAAPSDHLMLGATFVLLAAAPRADGGAVEVAPAEQFHCGWGSGYSDY